MALIILSVFGGVALLALFGAFDPLTNLADGYNQRKSDEQEHRQALERRAARHKERLAEAEKLHEVLAIAIADREMAGAIRDEIERVHPKVRVVEQDEVEEQVRTDRSKRGRRR